jgi:hypothetical protein
LATAVAVQFLFFLLGVRWCARAAVADPARAVADRAVVWGIDPHGYYAWLRSPLADGDLDFDNEFAYANDLWVSRTGARYEGRTPIGRHVNHWSVGPALAWAAGVVPVHAALGAVGLRGEGAEDGYTPPYHLAVAAVTLVLAVATLFLMYATARRFAPPVPAAAAAAGLALGTPLLAYGTTFPAMAHGPAAAALALFAYAWVRTLGSARAGRWFGLGVLLGVACLMRWQLVTFGVLLALEAAWSAARTGTRARWVGRLAVAAAGGVVGFLPQMAGWQAVYGRPLVNTHSSTPRPLWDPALWQVLASFDRGLLYWTPVTLVAAGAGGWAVARAGRRSAVPLAMLLTAAAVQVYAVALLVGGSVFLGSSFGFRILTETCVILAPGLAAGLALARPAAGRAVAAAVGVLAGWNMLLVIGSANNIVPTFEPATPAELLQAVAATFRRRPLEAAGVAVGAVAFAARLVAAARPPVAPPAAGGVRRAA